MSGSMTELNETCDFAFRVETSNYDQPANTEPLFNDTFYFSASAEASPDPTQLSISPVWALQQPPITVSPAESTEQISSITYKELSTLTEATFVATTITYTRVGKANFIEITMKRAREISRSSSISTHDTIFTAYNDSQSITSTPTSSVYDQPFYSPSTTPSSPELENKPFRKIHTRNDSAFLDSIEELPKEVAPQSVLIEVPTLKREEKNVVMIKTSEILPSLEADRLSTSNRLRRSKKSISDVWWYRR